MKIGVLALQGDYQAHTEMLHLCDATFGHLQVLAVRNGAQLSELDGLILPGGESTTMSRLCDRYELWPALHGAVRNGTALFGTCAGLILMSRNISGGTTNFQQKTLGVLDVDVARNAYGRQLDSFETVLEVSALQEMESTESNNLLRAVFIRAPRLERIGRDVQVLAHHDGEAVAVRCGAHFGCAFHPEISGDKRLHELWLRAIATQLPASTCTSSTTFDDGSIS